MRGDFRLEGWLVQPSLNRIEGPDTQVRVTPRAMAVLVCLAEARGEVVTKQELLDTVWGQAVVTEDVLTQCVVELRKAFGDRATSPAFIETIHRVGFRLIPPVRAADAPESSPATAASHPGWRGQKAALAIAVFAALAIAALLLTGRVEPPIAPIDSVAVLPFTNLSEDPELAYFGDGLSEELLNQLVRLPGLKVPARTSTFAFRGQNLDVREIGQQLGVASVLEGSVRRTRDRVRITAQLVGTRDGYHIWSETYDRPLADVLMVQDEISESIAKALHLRLSNEELQRLDRPTPVSLEAYDYYMLGEFHYREQESRERPGDWLERARGFYERSLELDPDFAPAHAGLARTYLPMLWSRRAHTFDESMASAQRSVDRALSLEPELPDAYVVQAWIRSNRLDFAGAAASARKAIELAPNDVAAMGQLAFAHVNQGNYAAALAVYRQQLALDPLNAHEVESIADGLARLGYRDEAVGHLRRIASRVERSDASNTVRIAFDYGEYDEVIRLSVTDPDGLFEAGYLADAWSRLGDRELAQAWFETAKAQRSYYFIVALPGVLYRLGQFDELAAVTRQAMEAQAMPRDRTLRPAQYRLLGASGVAQMMTGDFAEAVRYLEWRLEDENTYLWSLPSEYINGLTFLAYCARQLGDTERADAAIARALAVAEHTRQEGLKGYPPLTIALARLEALQGHRDAAIAALETAIAQGWRDYYVDVRLPIWTDLQDDAEFRRLMNEMKNELAAMRDRIRRQAWDVAPSAGAEQSAGNSP